MFFFYLRLNKRLSKQSWGWWFETPTRSLWRHRNVVRYNRGVGASLSGQACLLPISHHSRFDNSTPFFPRNYSNLRTITWINAALSIGPASGMNTSEILIKSCNHVVCKMSVILSWPQYVSVRWARLVHHPTSRPLGRTFSLYKRIKDVN